MKLIRVDLSPRDYVHVAQAPRIERRDIFARGGDNEWQMSGVVAQVERSGARAYIPAPALRRQSRSAFNSSTRSEHRALEATEH